VDFANLEKARNQMKDIASYVNEKKREFENISKVREIQHSFGSKAENFVDPTRRFVRCDPVALWTGTNDTDKKQSELLLNMFNELIVIGTQKERNGSLKFKEAIRIGKVSLKEAKMRRWTSKRAELGGSLTHPRTLSVDSPTDSPVVIHTRNGSISNHGSYNLDSLTGRRMSTDIGRRGSILCHYSVKNTIELVNSRDESLLKVVFDNPLAHASWIDDFKKLKTDLEKIEKFNEDKAMERTLHKSDIAKDQITESFSKIADSPEERKKNWRNTLEARRQHHLHSSDETSLSPLPDKHATS